MGDARRPRLKRPEPNGSEFDNYVAEALNLLLEERESWFKKHMTVGNMLTIGTLLVAIVIYWSDGRTHMANSEIHPARAERERLIDERIDLRGATNGYRRGEVERVVKMAVAESISANAQSASASASR